MPTRYTVASFSSAPRRAALPPAVPTLGVCLSGGEPRPGRRLGDTVEVGLDGRCIHVAGWLGEGPAGSPLLRLDTDLRANARDDRAISGEIDHPDDRVELLRAGVLGIAGVRLLLVNGYDSISTFQLVGPAGALLTLELLRSLAFRRGTSTCDPGVVRDVTSACVALPDEDAGGTYAFPMRAARTMLGGAFLDPYADAVPAAEAFDLALLAGAFARTPVSVLARSA